MAWCGCGVGVAWVWGMHMRHACVCARRALVLRVRVCADLFGVAATPECLRFAQMSIATGGNLSTSAMGAGVTEEQFVK